MAEKEAAAGKTPAAPAEGPAPVPNRASKKKAGSPKAGKKKQGELPGMPAKTELEKLAEKVLDAWEIFQGKKADLVHAKEELLVLMKKSNRSRIVLVDSDNVKRAIEYKDTEGISVKRATEGKD